MENTLVLSKGIDRNIDMIVVMRYKQWAIARTIVLFLCLGIAVFAVPGRNTSTASGNAALIDINRASAIELKTLPGIQDAYAAAIVKNRPYKNKSQLLSKQIIPEVAYGKIKKRIIAKQ